jgi:hypothetical protein
VIEISGQSKQWMHTHLPNKLTWFKRTSGYQKADGSCFLGQDRSTDGEIHARRDHSNIRNVLQNTKNLHKGSHSEQKSWQCSLHTTADTQALMEHFSWGLSDYPLTVLIALQATTTCLPSEELVSITLHGH